MRPNIEHIFCHPLERIRRMNNFPLGFRLKAIQKLGWLKYANFYACIRLFEIYRGINCHLNGIRYWGCQLSCCHKIDITAPAQLRKYSHLLHPAERAERDRERECNSLQNQNDTSLNKCLLEIIRISTIVQFNLSIANSQFFLY